MTSPSYKPVGGAVAIVGGMVYRQDVPQVQDVMRELYGDYMAPDFEKPKYTKPRDQRAILDRKYRAIKRALGEEI